jgi:hypothetical protein
MLDLVDTLRQWRRSGEPVSVVAIDPGQPPAAGAPALPSSETRDQGMASRLMQSIHDHPTNLFLVLTGNVHNRLQPGVPWDPTFEPMGYLLSRALSNRESLVALNVHYLGGEASYCTSSDESTCGPKALSEKWRSALERQRTPHERGVNLDRASEEPAYSGYFYIKSRLTASAPAVQAMVRTAASFPAAPTLH